MRSNLHLIANCFVTDSSGCHRYDYWNEQALFDGRSDTGWSTPSRTSPCEEYLEIDLGDLHKPTRVRIQARPIDDWPGFPRTLRVLARSGDEWVSVLHAKDVHAGACEWWEGTLEPIHTRSLRVEVYDVGWRPNGSYFLQFMQLELLEELAQ